MANNRLTVIGSNSFSGSTFVQYALEQGADVLGISRSAEPSPALLPHRWLADTAGSFDFAQLDLNRDPDEIEKRIAAFQPTVVVNFAAQGMVAESWQHPEHWYQTNVVGNVCLHDRLRKMAFLEKYVHVSTPEVYGSMEGKVGEDHPFNPSTPYAASRAACDLHLKTFFQNYDFPVVFTRAANVYGPGQQLYRIIPRTILYIKLGKKLQLHGGGHSVRSFIHIRDVAEATWKIAMAGTPPEAYHLSTDRFVSIRELVEMICTRMGVAFADVVEITEDRPGKDAAYLLDAAKARNELGWRDRVTLEDGLEETIRWVDHWFDELKNLPHNYIHKP